MDTIRIWKGWKMIRELGSGGFGKVYEIHRDIGGWTEKAAMKVIRIPSSQLELEQLRSEGISGESTEEYLARCVQDIQKEIGLMQHFMGCSNIVSYEDYLIRKQESGIGWDILIRMELLTPLSKILASRQLTDQEIYRLGIDISEALVICHKDGIIHRDVKPQNIFLNDHGSFKLGDFGISRAMPRSGDVLSFKGTVPYMAPETFAMRGTDARSDIYSLGLVLYRCLNRGREPFLPSTGFNPQDQELARMRRLRGEVLPPPERGSSELHRVLAIALAADPDKRYQTASQFQRALWSASHSREGGIAAHGVSPQMGNRLHIHSFAEKTELITQRFRGVDRRKILLSLCVATAGVLFFTGVFILLNSQKTVQEPESEGTLSYLESGSMDSENSGNSQNEKDGGNEAGEPGETQSEEREDTIEELPQEDDEMEEETENTESGDSGTAMTEEKTEDIVEFKDPALERAVRKQLSIGDGPITKSEALAQTHLDFSQEDKSDADIITDLTGLSAFENLEELLLSNNQIDHLEELQNMHSLKKLKLDFNQVSSLEPLQGLSSLEFLDLEKNRISDISPVFSLTNIYLLDVRGNQISDLSGISSMSGLKELLLGRNQIQDISPVAGLSNLRTLGFGHNQVEDIRSLSSLKELRKLTMGDNNIKDLSVVTSLPELNYLEVYQNPYSDKSPLEKLEGVKVITEQDSEDG